MVQWLGLCTFTAERAWVWGAKISQAARCGQKKENKFFLIKKKKKKAVGLANCLV